MKKLLVGLDIGTNSAGWCPCDENGKIIEKNGKRLWGSHLFDEANFINKKANKYNNLADWEQNYEPLVFTDKNTYILGTDTGGNGPNVMKRVK